MTPGTKMDGAALAERTAVVLSRDKKESVSPGSPSPAPHKLCPCLAPGSDVLDLRTTACSGKVSDAESVRSSKSQHMN